MFREVALFDYQMIIKSDRVVLQEMNKHSVQCVVCLNDTIFLVKGLF